MFARPMSETPMRTDVYGVHTTAGAAGHLWQKTPPSSGGQSQAAVDTPGRSPTPHPARIPGLLRRRPRPPLDRVLRVDLEGRLVCVAVDLGRQVASVWSAEGGLGSGGL